MARRRGLSGAVPGRAPRATGPAEGDRAPLACCAATPATGPNRRWVVDLCPRADPVRGTRRTAFATRAPAPAASSAGPPARAWGTDNAVSALEQAIQARKERGPLSLRLRPMCPKRSRRARSAGARISGGLVHYCDHGSKRLPRRPQPDDSSKRGPGASAGAVGSSYAGAAAQAPGKPPCKRGIRRGATAPGRDAPTPATATARWVDWCNRTRPHLTNDDGLPSTTAAHRNNHNHTTTPPTTV